MNELTPMGSDATAVAPGTEAWQAGSAYRISWLRAASLLAFHASPFLILLVGWSSTAGVIALITFAARAFGLTGFYHRYYAHRAFKTSRWFQFLGALLGASAAQRGPIWWAGHHRAHHAHTDQEGDPHSPRQGGFWWSHVGWFLTRQGGQGQPQLIKDWLRYPELRILDRYHWIVPLLFGCLMYVLGEVLGLIAPGLQTDGWQILVWGFFVSTLFLYHVTYAVNSLGHIWGQRRYDIPDDSRNNWLLAVLTLGEGWHNNHHQYPALARQGFRWWEIDITYDLLVLLSWSGLIWNVRGELPDENPIKKAAAHHAW